MAEAGRESDAPPPGDGWGVPAPVPPGEGGRPGPEQIEADSWDSEPGPVTVAYEGRRRAPTPSRRLWLLVGLAGAALAAAIVVPLVFTGTPDTPAPAAPPVSSAAALPTEASASTSATTPPATTRPAPRPTTPRPTTPRPVFTPITLEAELATLAGSANVDTYPGASGGKIVFNVGDWGSRRGPGTVTFQNIVIPTAGRYVLTITSVHPDGEVNRSATITVSGITPVSLAFVGSATCCQTKEVTVTIPAGTHTITIANPTGRAPAIDKLAVRAAA